MNFKAVKLLTALMFSAAFSNLFGQDTRSITLEESIQIGLENSKQLHTAKLSVDYSEAKFSEVKTERLPSVKFDATYTRLSEIDPYSIATPFGTFDLTQNITNFYNLKLSVQQPLFTGFRLQSGTDMAGLNVSASKEDFIKNRKELILNIKSAYWTLFKVNKFKEVIDENVELMKAHLTDVQNLYEQGLVTNNDVLKIQVQLAEAKLRQIDVQNSVQLAMTALNNVIGLPLSTKIILKEQLNLNVEEMNDLNSLLSKAYEGRNDLKAMGYRVKASESGITMAKSGWYPQLYLVGNYNYSNPNQRYFPLEEKFQDSWDVSLALSFDLWNWNKNLHLANQAEVNYEQAVDGLKLLKDAVELEVTQSYLNLLQAKEKLSVSDFSVKQATENYRVASELFKQGLTLNSELLDAEVALLQAKTNYVQTMVDYKLAKAGLEKAIGE